jgi:peptide/nickel transport system substrate-binding protein
MIGRAQWTPGRDVSGTTRGIRARRRVAMAAGVMIAAAVLTGCDGGNGEGDQDGTVAPTASGAANVVGDWGGIYNPGGDPVSGGTLIIDQSTAPASISPLDELGGDNTRLRVLTAIFDRLVEYMPGSLDPQPGLAESWDVSADGATYTFHLRAAEFSDGTPVTSADVAYSLNLYREPEGSSTELDNMISSVATPDESTVTVELTSPTPTFLYWLATPYISIFPEAYVEKVGMKEFNEHPVGSGPFVLERWVRDQEVVLVRNDNYWREGLPYLDEVRFRVIPDDNTRTLNVQSGTSHIGDLIPFSQIETLNQSDSADVFIAPAAEMNVIFVNNAKPPLDETAVRQALAYATDVESINNVIFQGLATQMNTVTPKLKYWPEDLSPYPYDVEKAKQLLSTSSVPSGFSASISIRGGDQPSSQIAQILQQSWKEIGVELIIDPIDEATHWEVVTGGDYELAVFPPGTWTSDLPIEDEFAEWQFTDNIPLDYLFTWYDNPEVAELTREALTSTSESERSEFFTQMHVAAMEDPELIPLTYTPNRAAVSETVHDFPYLFNGVFRLDTVWIG